MKIKALLIILAALAVLLLSGCENSSESARKFYGCSQNQVGFHGQCMSNCERKCLDREHDNWQIDYECANQCEEYIAK